MKYIKEKYEALAALVTKEDCESAKEFVEAAIDIANKSNVSFQEVFVGMLRAVQKRLPL